MGIERVQAEQPTRARTERESRSLCFIRSRHRSPQLITLGGGGWSCEFGSTFGSDSLTIGSEAGPETYADLLVTAVALAEGGCGRGGKRCDWRRGRRRREGPSTGFVVRRREGNGDEVVKIVAVADAIDDEEEEGGGGGERSESD